MNLSLLGLLLYAKIAGVLADRLDLAMSEIENKYVWPVKNEMPGTEGIALDCTKVIGPARDETYMKNFSMNRITRSNVEDFWLPTDCSSIRQRHTFAKHPLNIEEANYPVAYARAVYRDYLFLESEFAAEYQPQNSYCFVLDASSPDWFKQKMRALATCFSDNTFVVDREFSMSSLTGANQALYECLSELANPNRGLKWKYVLVMENNDFQLYTNAQLVWNLRQLGGRSIVGVNLITPDKPCRFNWSFEALNIFKTNATARLEQIPKEEQTLKFGWGYNEMVLVREAADYIVMNLNLTKAMDQFSANDPCVDYRISNENVWPSLMASAEALGIPGGNILMRIRFTFICRYAQAYERFTPGRNRPGCYTGYLRHYFCMLGVEELEGLSHSEWFGNKFWPEWDMGAVACWHEWMWKRRQIESGCKSCKNKID